MFNLTRMNKVSPAQLAAMASTLCQMQDLELRILNGTGSIEKAARQINIRLYTAAQRSGAFHKSLFALPMVTAYSDNHGLPFNRDFPLQLNLCQYVAYKPLFGDVRIRNLQTGEEFVTSNRGIPLMEKFGDILVFNGARVLNNTPYEDITGTYYPANPVKEVEEDDELVMG
ncbi:hypothetical protein HOV30_gp173 [Erwinia phage Derbicus]|uniref:Uncharacterized protein n=1 Tax=Erwinia phage Derbicus TaxID=2530027 RepID=A0A482IK98_9CAUD|nr:hypothetical protein HOV30_gp173 [Erwinia phage Derbicus]QBP07599.1 hypothetical protein DERBICUS_173 [Erwinia phage Derbicus]